MSMDYELEELSHDDCLGNDPDSPCEGIVEMRCTEPPRFRANGTMIMFPRCMGHYEKYVDAANKRERRMAAREASLYCKHGTYIGDPYGPDYLCGACEGGR